jgi:hypothetical protein
MASSAVFAWAVSSSGKCAGSPRAMPHSVATPSTLNRLPLEVGDRIWSAARDRHEVTGWHPGRPRKAEVVDLSIIAMERAYSFAIPGLAA